MDRAPPYRSAAAVAIDPARDGIIHKFFHTADVRAVGVIHFFRGLTFFIARLRLAFDETVP